MPNTSTKFTIPTLTEKNYTTWLIDIRAVLRKAKIWTYTQTTYVEYAKKEDATITGDDWEQGAIEAADTIVPTISTGIKQRLSEAHFDDGYLLLSRLKELLQPLGETQFMRLQRELYTLDSHDFKDSSDLFTHIKILEEQIDSTKVELTGDKRTLLALTMAHWKDRKYRTLIQFWQSTPGMTSERARQMLLEEEQVQMVNDDEDVKILQIRKGKHTGGGKSSEHCNVCNKGGHIKEECWEEHPELAPEWLQPRLVQRKKERTGKKGTEEGTKSPWDVQ